MGAFSPDSGCASRFWRPIPKHLPQNFLSRCRGMHAVTRRTRTARPPGISAWAVTARANAHSRQGRVAPASGCRSPASGCRSGVLVRIERRGAFGRAIAGEGELLDLGLGLLQEAVAMFFESLAAFVNTDGLFEFDVAELQAADNGLELLQGALEGHLCD